MAYTAGNLHKISGGPPGRSTYRYDSTDHPDVVEAAGYFNNVDDNLNLARGDFINVVQWSAVDTGTISRVLTTIVTNVISVDAAASAGAVNIAEYGLATGLLSSGT